MLYRDMIACNFTTHTRVVILCRDIPARYLLRLGMGERDLDVDDDFSRAGRVNNMLARRLTLLAEVWPCSVL